MSDELTSGVLDHVPTAWQATDKVCGVCGGHFMPNSSKQRHCAACRIKTSESFEMVGRWNKAKKLAAVLVEHKINAPVAAGMTDPVWGPVIKLAGLTSASEATRTLALLMVKEMAK